MPYYQAVAGPNPEDEVEGFTEPPRRDPMRDKLLESLPADLTGPSKLAVVLYRTLEEMTLILTNHSTAEKGFDADTLHEFLRDINETLGWVSEEADDIECLADLLYN